MRTLMASLVGFIALILASFSSANIQAESQSSFSVDGFSQQLQASVNDGEVDYSHFENNADYQAFVDAVAEVDVDAIASTEEKLVFYINAYNALSIKGILDGRSPKSYFGKIGFFYLADYRVAGEKINLYDLEHQRIRKLNEPRIHFALVCSAKSCPKLRSEAYQVDRLDQQLDENARDFINDTSKNAFDKDKKVARLSKIFKWFEEDFEVNGQTLQQYIAQYVADPEVADDLANNRYDIKYMKYDWSLNGTK